MAIQPWSVQNAHFEIIFFSTNSSIFIQKYSQAPVCFWMDPLIERAADGANRDAPRRKAFIVINFTRMVKQAQAADKQRREKKDAIQHTMKERGDDGRDGSWLLVFYSRVLRDSSSHLLLIITHAAEKERGRGRIALETQDRWKKKSHSSSRWLVGPIFFSTLKATSKRASAS